MAFSLLDIPPKAAKITDEDARSKFFQIKMGYDIFSCSYSQIIVTFLSVPSKRAACLFPLQDRIVNLSVFSIYVDKAAITFILTNNVVDPPDLVDP
jgi:hypothetical protein